MMVLGIKSNCRFLTPSSLGKNSCDICWYEADVTCKIASKAESQKQRAEGVYFELIPYIEGYFGYFI